MAKILHSLSVYIASLHVPGVEKPWVSGFRYAKVSNSEGARYGGGEG